MEGSRDAVPPRFEHAITGARLAGAAAAVAIGPFLPNLGPIAIGLLAGTLVAAAIVLHVLSSRVRDAAGGERLSWVAFAFDVAVVSFTILLVTPDPMWPLVPLIGVLLIITTTFRLGTAGAVASTAALTAALLVIAIWRERALGLALPTAHVGFDVVMYCLAALLMTSMLREVGALRRERLDLMRQVGDVEVLRRSEREHGELLQHERRARTAAEVTMAQLDAAQRISDIALRHTSLDELLPDTLQAVADILGARVAVILTPASDGLAQRAAIGLAHRPRVALRPSGDLARAQDASEPVVVRDASTVALEALATAPIESQILVPLRGRDRPMGVLYLGFELRQDLTANDRALLTLIAGRVVAALERAERFEAERQAREAAETAAQRAQLLLEAADAILETADVVGRLDRLARLVVPKLADSCGIDLLRAGGSLERVAVAAADTERERDLWMIAHRYPPTSEGRDPLWEVIRTRTPQCIEHLGPEDLERLARSPQHLRLLMEGNVRSWMAVPIVSGDRSLGVMELFSSESRRVFTADHVATAEALASRVAVAARGGSSDTMG